MRALLFLLLWPGARQVVWDASRAVEADSVALVVARWTAALQHDPTDRLAALGLATIARLRYASDADQRYQALAPTVGAPRDLVTVYASLGQAEALYFRGQVKAAAPWYARSAALARALGDSAAQAEALIGMVGVRRRMQGQTQAVATMDSAARLIPAGDLQLTAWQHCGRAFLLEDAGRSGAAESAEGAAIAHRIGDRRLEGRCVYAAAWALVRTGQSDSAARVLAATEEIQRRAHDRAALARTLQFDAWQATVEAKLERAGRRIREALIEARAADDRTTMGYLLILRSENENDVGDLTAAGHDASEAAALLESVGDSGGVIESLGVQGRARMDAGDTAGAHALFATELDYDQRGGKLAARADVYAELADAAVRSSDWPAAARALDRERAVYEHTEGSGGWRTNLTADEATLALRRGDVGHATRLLRTVLAHRDTSEHNERYLAESQLAEAVLDAGDTTRAESVMQHAADELDQWRSGLSDRELRLLAFQWRHFGGPGPSAATVVAGAAARGDLAVSFALAERRRARELADDLARADALRSTAGPIAGVGGGAARPGDEMLDRAQRALPDDATAVLEYVTGPGPAPTTLFVVSRSRTRAYRLAPEAALADEIGRFVAIVRSGVNPRAISHSLGNRLLGSALADLDPSVRSLVIVPDGVLYHVPFPALAANGFDALIERYAVSQVPSAAIAARLWRRQRATRRDARLLAFGDPAFATGSGPGSVSETYRDAFTRSGGLPRLPASADEVRRVARFAMRPVVRLREDASAAYLERARLDSFAVIHFATHALVDEGTAARTALALAPTDGNDGFVGPGDLAALNLSADLVVLSACRTAGGVVIGGEGIRGLTAPLLAAGAQAVVASQWEVGDRGTVALMEDFYRGLATGRAAAEALRVAELAARQGGRPAREWAAFTLVGDPTVRVPLTIPWYDWFWRASH